MRNSLFVPDIFGRYLSTGLAFIILLALTKFLGVQDFSLLQIGYGFGALALWLGDFGLGTKVLIHLSKNQKNYARESWYLRLSLVVFVLFLTAITILPLNLPFSILFFIAASLDLLSDSNLNLRQVTAIHKKSLFFQAGKRFIQLLLLLAFGLTQHEFTPTSVLLIIGLPSVLLILMDSFQFGNFKVSNIAFHLNQSWKKWFHTGGTAMVNLDYLIIGFTGNYLALATLAVAKKIFNGIAIIGTAAFPRILYDVAATNSFTILHRRFINKTIMYVMLPILVVQLYLDNLLTYILNVSPNSSQIWMTRTLVILLPVYIYALAFNSILLGLNLNRSAAVATYTSGLIYILVLTLILIFENVYLIISLASVLNALSWLLIQMYFFHSYKKTLGVHN